MSLEFPLKWSGNVNILNSVHQNKSIKEELKKQQHTFKLSMTIINLSRPNKKKIHLHISNNWCQINLKE